MSLLISSLKKTSSVKNLFILFFLSHLIFLLMMIYTLPVISNQIGIKVFDLQTFGYSVSTAELIVNGLESQTTSLYLFPQLTVLDVLYPFLLALFLSSLLFRLTKVKNSLRSILLVIPFFAMLFDYLENICIALLITKTVPVSRTIVFLSSTFTVLKGILTTISWLAILILFVLMIKHIFFQKRTKSLKEIK